MESRNQSEIQTEKNLMKSTKDAGKVSAVQKQISTLVLIGAFFTGLFFLLNIPFTLQLENRVANIIFSGIGLGIVFHLYAWRSCVHNKYSKSSYFLIIGLFSVFITTSLFWQENIPIQELSFIVLSVLIGTAYKPKKWGWWILILVGFLGITTLTQQFIELPQIPAPPVQYTSLLWITIVLWYVASFFWAQKIRTRLLITSITSVILTGIAISVGSALIGIRNGEQQAFQKLELIATLREVELKQWQEDLKTGLARALRQAPEYRFVEPETQETLLGLLDFEESTEEHTLAYQEIVTIFDDFLRQYEDFNTVFFADRDGNILVASEEELVGNNISNTEYFQQGLTLPFLSLPIFPSTQESGVVYVTRPILGDFGRLLGVLGGEANLNRLNEVITREEESSLGATGETYLVSQDQNMLIGSRFLDVGSRIESPGINQILEEKSDFSGMISNYDGEIVVGVYKWIDEYGVALVAEQTRREAFREVNRTITLNAVIAALSVTVASIAALLIAENIGSPLSELAQVAEKIAAGNLEETITIKRQDEIGTLASTFQDMTIQLREFIGNLEEMVRRRTLALEQRSSYLEASFEVGQTAATILEEENLIKRVVEVIQDRFELYYVGLFLIDNEKKWANLKAGTGNAGEQMLANSHKLSVGGSSMIGQCVLDGKPRIALDVGEEAVRFENPLLPETRSEAALPLISRAQTIGALTIQSNLPNAFDEDIVTVLQTMADQVALAIRN